MTAESTPELTLQEAAQRIVACALEQRSVQPPGTVIKTHAPTGEFRVPINATKYSLLTYYVGTAATEKGLTLKESSGALFTFEPAREVVPA